MAGEWIAWCKGLTRKPEVLAISRATHKSRREVACILMEFWEWADDHTTDGRITGMGLSDLPLVVTGTTERFWLAVEQAGWLLTAHGVLTIPHFERWTGESAKARLERNARQARWRRSKQQKGGADDDSDVDAGASTNVDAKTSTEAPTRKERRKEESRNSVPTERAGKPPGTHQAAVDFFCAAWGEKYGQKYPFNAGKDGEVIKFCLDRLDRDLSKWQAVVGRYLQDESDFIADKNHPLGILKAQLATWLVPAKQRATAAGGDNLVDWLENKQREERESNGHSP
jgi:hypothetical protein